ncbi:auxin efflux carrier [Lipomyces oligophaga]|uniref:auxin efflux carrier n=1 Tax=Lipomyces oligophaga TaxID=45792 RepID=UPI0034CD916B
MSMTVGASIYVAVKPIVKIFLSVSAGFYFSRIGVLDIHTSKKVSTILLNYFLPCIVFSKVVVAFDSNNMQIAGFAALTAVLYIVVGVAIALILRYVVKPPKFWRGGSTVAAIFNNSGDIPMAYVMTITSGPPFSDGDEDKGIAYVTIIMSVYLILLFTCGAVQLIEGDFQVPITPDMLGLQPDGEKPETPSKKRKFNKMWTRKKKRTLDESMDFAEDKEEEELEDLESSVIHPPTDTRSGTNVYLPNGLSPVATAQSSILRSSTSPLGKVKTATSIASASSRMLLPVESAGVRSIRQRINAERAAKASRAGKPIPDIEQPDDIDDQIQPAPTIHHNDEEGDEDDDDRLDPIVTAVTVEIRNEGQKNLILSRLMIFLHSLCQPPAASMIISIIIAVIDPVKALFVATDYNMRTAPDGLPPLDFVMDFTKFVGNANVPMGLLLLGGTIGRLSVKQLPPRFWRVMVSMVLLKLVVLPIIAIAFTQALRRYGLVPEDNLILAFVFIMASAVPSATTQIYLTIFFAPDDAENVPQLDCIAAVLILQYVVLILTLAILVTYTLQIVI